MLMMASYFLVFYLSTIYDTDELTVNVFQLRAAKKYSDHSVFSPAFLLFLFPFSIILEIVLKSMDNWQTRKNYNK
jgi:hypothetical protein